MLVQLSTLFVLALAATASPFIARKSPVNIPLARKFNFTGGANVLKADQARAAALRAAASGGTHQVPVTNTLVSYTASVGVGTPPQPYTLIVDTGSSNTWVGANDANPYKESSSSVDTLEELLLAYGSGFMIGTLWDDTVTLGDLSLTNQGIGAADLAIGFQGVDGILGIGPVDLTSGSILGSDQTIPTVTDTAWNAGLLDSYEIGVFFAPTTSASDENGQITFGGVDSTKCTTPVNYVPITSTSSANLYWGIDQTVTYGTSGSPIFSPTAGIVDTGTTLTLIATDALARYQNVTGAVSDEDTGLLKITPDQYDNLQSLYFTIGSQTYEFTKNAQIWPRALNSAIGGNADSVYLIVGDIGSSTGSGLDFINGMTWLERFYSVYDTGNQQVGFAETAFTFATTN